MRGHPGLRAIGLRAVGLLAVVLLVLTAAISIGLVARLVQHDQSHGGCRTRAAEAMMQYIPPGRQQSYTDCPH